MTRAAPLTVLAVALGFVAGLAWGRSTRNALTGAVQTTTEGGKIIVSIDAGGAAKQGLTDALRGYY